MNCVNVTNEAIKAIKEFKLPKEIGFGKIMAPVMIEAKYKGGKWHSPKLIPYGKISMFPTAKVFHYGQEIFEGIKAYKVAGAGPYLFRIEDNADRFEFSAKRMAIPPIPKEYFLDGVRTITSYCANFIPTRTGESLYIRPFIYATEESLGIRPSMEYTFMIIASPSGAYFTSQAVQVYIERNAVRACPGGTGNAKTGGNYAASLLATKKANQLGCMQTLWLDALEKSWIEEMSGMNFMSVINGKLVTPKITDTILRGITRDSILKYASFLGLQVFEEKLSISKMIDDIESQKATEAFACGTAAIITPISHLAEESGKRYELKESFGPISKKLRQGLLDLQEGRIEDPFNWRENVGPAII